MKPVTVHSVNDIKRVISEFDPAINPKSADIALNTLLEANEDGKKNIYEVSVKTRSKSKRDLLIEGLTIIKNREEAAKEEKNSHTTEVNGMPMRAVILNKNTEGRSSIDPLITQWTGGSRDGTLIVWELDDGYRYKYDAFAHSLSRVSRS